MKRFVITTILDVADSYRERRVSKDMVQNFLKQRSGHQIIDEKGFRGNVVMEIIDVESTVIEL